MSGGGNMHLLTLPLARLPRLAPRPLFRNRLATAARAPGLATGSHTLVVAAP